MRSSSSWVAFPILTILLINFVAKGFGCFSAFKNAQNISFVQMDCTKSAGFPTMPSTEDLTKEGFDDRCLSKCILNGLLMIDNDGQIDKDFLLDFMEMNAPESYLLKLSELATSCTESSGADKVVGGTKVGKSAKECMPMKNLFSCFLQGSEKKYDLDLDLADMKPGIMRK